MINVLEICKIGYLPHRIFCIFVFTIKILLYKSLFRTLTVSEGIHGARAINCIWTFESSHEKRDLT